MVQRKIPDKLGIPAETKNHMKSDKQKPSSSSCHHHQDIRNKGGTEMKKKMKKSRSFKLTESHVRQEKSKLDKKAADLPAATVVTTPQKSTLIKISDMSPNYMKSTSSSDARKERSSSVSPRISQTSCDNKSQNKRSSKNSNSSSSSHKPLKALTKSGSLKPVRTLTKSSSMKAVRPSMKKSSGIGLFPDLNAGNRRATCSSTLKDSKFPDYLKINPGRTESEGTSVMKVCPYTYCSLNGHHHAPSPQLKSFLSSRRRLMKTQKSMRLRCLSPVRTKSGKTKTEIDTGQISFDRDDDTTPQIEETSMDFFVEIFAKARENNDGSNHSGDDKAKNEFTIFPEVQHDILSSITDGAETETENGETVSKSMPDDSSHSEVSFEEILDQSSDFVIAEVNIFEHDQQVEIEETDYPPTSLVDESVFEASDMDWEEEEVPAELAQNGSADSTINDDNLLLLTSCLTGFNDPGMHELVYKPDDIFSDCSQEVLVNGDELQEVVEEKSETFDMECDTGDSESGGDMMSEIDICSHEKDGDTEPDESSVDDDRLQELRAANEDRDIVTAVENDFTQENLLLEDNEIPCSEVYINPMEEQEQDYLQDEPETDQSLSSGNPYIDAEVGQLNEPENLSCGIERQTFATADSMSDQDLATSTISPDPLLSSGDVTNGAEEKGKVEDGETNPLLGGGDITDGAEEKDKVGDADVSLGINFSDGEGTDAVETCLTNNATGAEEKKRIIKTNDSHQQVIDISSNLKKTHRCKKQIEEDSEELRDFNPRDPNYLPVVPEPEGEKVDLRQQMMDERKNAEEWMLDFALRQAVNKLAPARKRKVALLVEAFETVAPQPKFESRLKHGIPAFTHTWPMQACS